MQLYPTLFCGIAQIYAAIYWSLLHHINSLYYMRRSLFVDASTFKLM